MAKRKVEAYIQEIDGVNYKHQLLGQAVDKSLQKHKFVVNPDSNGKLLPIKLGDVVELELKTTASNWRTTSNRSKAIVLKRLR